MKTKADEILMEALDKLGGLFLLTNDLSERSYLLNVQEVVIEAMKVEVIK